MCFLRTYDPRQLSRCVRGEVFLEVGRSTDRRPVIGEFVVVAVHSHIGALERGEGTVYVVRCCCTYYEEQQRNYGSLYHHLNTRDNDVSRLVTNSSA